MITIELTYKGPGFSGATQKEFCSEGGFRAWLKSEAFAPFPEKHEEPQKGETPEEATPEVSETKTFATTMVPDMIWVDKLLFPDRDDYETLLALGMPRDWGEQRARSMMAVMRRTEVWDGHDGPADAVIVLWLAQYQGLTPTGRVSQSKSKQILLSFRDQVETWLDDDRPVEGGDPGLSRAQTKYESPLSRKQWLCARRWYGYETAKRRAKNLVEKAQVVDEIGPAGGLTFEAMPGVVVHRIPPEQPVRIAARTEAAPVNVIRF